jgi:hypothetical protein
MARQSVKAGPSDFSPTALPAALVRKLVKARIVENSR